MPEHRVNPAKFIVIDDRYPQIADYPEFCAKTTEKLLAHSFLSLDQLVDEVAQAIKKENSSIETHTLYASSQNYNQHYAEPRLHDGCWQNLSTILSDEAPGYRAAYRRFLTREFGTEYAKEPFGWQAEYQFHYVDQNDQPRYKQVNLSTVSNCKRDENNVLRPQFGEETLYHTSFRYADTAKLVWKEVQRLFDNALNTDYSKKRRVESAIDCYWLISHYCPFTRRSATLARITLAYLEEKVGFQMPPMKAGYDLNVEALLHSLHGFKQALEKEELFDRSLAPADIMDWHAQACNKRLSAYDLLKHALPANYSIHLLEATPLLRQHTPPEYEHFDFTYRLREDREKSPRHFGHGV